MDKVEEIKKFIEDVDFDCSCPNECHRDFKCEDCGFYTITKKSLIALAERLKEKESN